MWHRLLLCLILVGSFCLPFSKSKTAKPENYKKKVQHSCINGRVNTKTYFKVKKKHSIPKATEASKKHLSTANYANDKIYYKNYPATALQAKQKKHKNATIKTHSGTESAVLPAKSLNRICHRLEDMSILVVDARTQKILIAKNANLPRKPASLTKFMVLNTLSEMIKLSKNKINLDTQITLSKKASMLPPSCSGLPAGSKIKLRDAFALIMTHSCNDIAHSIAENMEQITGMDFIKLMNKFCKKYNMNQTKFYNASGLPSHNITTALDMAKLCYHAIKNPNFLQFCTIKKFFYRKKTYHNHNKLLGLHSNGVFVYGFKTGYTDAAGFNIAVGAKKGNKNLIIIILKAPSKYIRSECVKKIINQMF